MKFKKKEPIEINGVIYTPVGQEIDYEDDCKECQFSEDHKVRKCSCPYDCPFIIVDYF